MPTGPPAARPIAAIGIDECPGPAAVAIRSIHSGIATIRVAPSVRDSSAADSPIATPRISARAIVPLTEIPTPAAYGEFFVASGGYIMSVGAARTAGQYEACITASSDGFAIAPAA